jgi:glycosyltransferase involved in cell wall biosynthesis
MVNKKKNSICCIIFSFNNKLGLIKNLNKFLNLEHKFDEIIIVNDGSSDGTKEYLSKLKYKNIYIINNKINLGINKSFNKALYKVKSKYIFAATTDDKYSNNIVKIYKDCLKKFEKKKPCLVFGNAIGIYERSKKKISQNLKIKNYTYFNNHQFAKFYHDNPFAFFGGNVILETQLTKRFGGYINKMNWHSDWLLYLLISLNYGCIYINKIIANRIINKNSYSSNMNNIFLEKKNIICFLKFIRKFKDFQKFKDLSILPNYNFFLYIILMKEKIFREYNSFKLTLKILQINLGKILKIFFTQKLRLTIRQMLKI